MANYFNFYTNWRKAKDYDRLKKENSILSERLNKLGKDVFILGNYSCGRIDNMPIDLHPMFNFLAEHISKLKSMNIDYQCEIIRLNLKLQRRDTKTGRFVKK